MGAFLHALGHIAKTGWDATIPGQRMEENDRRHQSQFNEYVQSMLDRGAKPIQVGAVNDDGVLRPPDKTRVVTEKDPSGKKISFELPTVEEQRARKVHGQIQDAMDMQRGTAPLRREAAAENLQDSEAMATMQGRVSNDTHRTQRSNDLNDFGIALPGRISKSLGMESQEGEAPRKFLPSEVGSLSNTASDLALADERDAKAGQTPAKEVLSHQITTDGKTGAQTLQLVYKDGTNTEVPLKSKGKVERPAGEMTAYESTQLSRADKKDAEGRLDKQSTVLQSAATKAQKELDDLQTKQLTVQKTIEQAEASAQGIEEGIKNGVYTKGALAKAISDKAKFAATAKGARDQWTGMEEQKKAANKRRQGILDQGKAFGDARAAGGQAAGASSGDPLVRGTHSFPTKEAADEFTRRTGIK